MKQILSCCFTGHRPNNLPWGKREGDQLCRRTREILALAVEHAYLRGYRRFYSGMAMGIDLMAAEVVLNSRLFFPEVELVAAIPFPAQTRSWPQEQVIRYQRILEQCRRENIHVLAPTYTKGCMNQRDRYMVDHSQCLIAVYNGSSQGGTAYTLTYALQRGLKTMLIDPSDPQALDWKI